MATTKNKRRADGRKQASIYLGIVDGKKKYKYIYAATDKELNRKLDEARTQLGKGLDLSAQHDTVSYWWDNWLKIKQAELSDKKFRAYKAKEKYIRPVLNMPVNKVHAMDIQSIIYDNTQLADDTLRQLRNILRQTFQLAVINRVIDYNPVDGVRMPKRREKEQKRRALVAVAYRFKVAFQFRITNAPLLLDILIDLCFYLCFAFQLFHYLTFFLPCGLRAFRKEKL